MCRVLVVDDQITSRETTVALLENEGHTCAETSNGQEALDWLMVQSELPCIILLDLRMPVMDGWDFLRVVRGTRNWARIAVIVVSGTVERNRPQPVLPANGFWSKPLDPEKLRLLHTFCERHRETWSPRQP